jgi:hypothetical protein
MAHMRRWLVGWGVLLCCVVGLMGCAPTVAEPPATVVPLELPTTIPTAVPLATDPPPTATLPPTSTPASQIATPVATGPIWVMQAQGVQCEGNKFTDLKDAVSQLQAQGVTVIAAEEVEMMVMTVCGGPTSTHYRVQIQAEGLDTAVSLGWTAEQ